jgi:hypothetical protein
MKNTNYYKRLFLVGGIWNLAAALSCWILSIAATSLFFELFDMPTSPSLFAFHSFFAIVLALGIGYIMVSKDINRNHAMVTVGILGKALFFLVCLITFIQNDANFLLLLIGIVDLIFAILFWEFLQRFRKSSDKA